LEGQPIEAGVHATRTASTEQLYPACSKFSSYLMPNDT
jgi:hypothetical protein